MWAVHVGESACGLDCHVIRRSLSQVSFGSRLCSEPWVWRHSEAAVGGQGVRGCRGVVKCGGLGLRPSVVFPWLWVWARVDPSPFMPAPVCRSVSGDFLWHGISLGTPLSALGRGGGGNGVALPL